MINFIGNPIYVLTLLCLMVLLSLAAAKTKWGKPAGSALLVIVFTAILANFKLIPSASNSIPLYDAIFKYLAPISIFYLLLGANLNSIKKAGLPMIGLFLIGSLATFGGVMVAWYLISPESILGKDAVIIAGMLSGSYTGGSVNFNAIALAYDFQERGTLYAGTIAVDNVITAIWVIITIAFPKILRRFFPDNTLSSAKNDEMVKGEEGAINLLSLSWLLIIGLSAFLVSDLLSTVFPDIPSILTISTLGILLAQTPFISKLKGGHTLGLYLVYLFLAVIGAYCEIDAVIALRDIGLILFLFTLILVVVHGLLIIILGAFTYRDWDMISIASQANIGGGTSAIALAETFNRKELILPAILVGTLGNALGTYIGFLVVVLLQ